MIAKLTADGRLSVEEGHDAIPLGRARGRDRRAVRLHATRMLRAAGYGDLGQWQTASDEQSAVRRIGSWPPPRPTLDIPPSAPDPDVPAPAVGDVVMPREGVVWCGRPLRVEPSTVVAVHDYRPGLDECVVVIQPTAVVEHLRRGGHPVNPDHGAYVGLVDVHAVAACCEGGS